MQRQKRKNEHLRYAVHLENDYSSTGLTDLQLIPDALPQLALEQIDISTRLGDFALAVPLIINAITGGSQEAGIVNKLLAQTACHCQLPMAVGSQTIALNNKAARESFQVVRKNNPQGLVFANIGASVKKEQAQEAVEMLEANALQIHLNVAQELNMSEGDRDFTGYLENIFAIKDAVSVPVIVKEVGCGLSRECVQKLKRAGLNLLDIGGKGGTNFIAIEKSRQNALLEKEVFLDWGLSTAVSLLEALQEEEIQIIASGGLTNGLDLAKVLAVGAQSGAIAGLFLKTLTLYGDKALIEQIEKIKKELKTAMLLVGAKNISQLQQKPVVILGQTAVWLQARNIDTNKYARR